MTTTFTRSTSSGNHTLAELLTWSILDYQRAFGKEPRLIVIPYFRRDEMAARHADRDCEDEINRFLGIPFRFSTVSDFIELSNGY